MLSVLLTTKRTLTSDYKFKIIYWNCFYNNLHYHIQTYMYKLQPKTKLQKMTTSIKTALKSDCRTNEHEHLNEIK